LQYLVRGLASPDRVQRIGCAQALGNYSKLGAVPLAALQDAAHDPDASVRSAAVYSLRVFQQPAAVNAVLEVSHDPKVRLETIFTLNCQGTDEAMARLQEMATDVPQVAHEVIRVAADSKSPLARNVLIAALPSPDKMVRIHALAALFGLGDDNVRYTLADEMATMHPSTQAQIIEPWLFSAVGRRHLAMPKWSASQEEYGRAWVDWLRQAQLTKTR
ncbi:MAG: HEAT repeat domain-containing protein, partial [Armatimonadota bacterium]